MRRCTCACGTAHVVRDSAPKRSVPARRDDVDGVPLQPGVELEPGIPEEGGRARLVVAMGALKLKTLKR